MQSVTAEVKNLLQRRAGAAGEIGEDRQSLEADGESELAERQPVGGGKLHRPVREKSYQAETAGIEQRREDAGIAEPLLVEEPGKAAGIEEEAAQPERIVGRPVAVTAQREEGRDRRVEIARCGTGECPNRVLRLTEGDEAVQCVMHPHRLNQRPREISAHLPGEADDVARSRSAEEALESGLCELHRIACIGGVAGCKARLAERVDPLGQIVEVLAVAIPLEPLVHRFIGVALAERLADPQAPRRRMLAPGLLVEPADPAAAQIVAAVAPEHMMHLVDQFDRQTAIAFIAGARMELEEVQDRECICP